MVFAFVAVDVRRDRARSRGGRLHPRQDLCQDLAIIASLAAVPSSAAGERFDLLLILPATAQPSQCDREHLGICCNQPRPRLPSRRYSGEPHGVHEIVVVIGLGSAASVAVFVASDDGRAEKLGAPLLVS